MRLAIVSTFPPRRCGIGIYTKNLADGLRKNKADFTVFSFREHRYAEKFVVPSLSKNDLWSYIDTVSLIKHNRFTHVLIQHEYLFYNPVWFLFFLFLLRIRNVKVSLVMHTIVPYEHGPLKWAFTIYHTKMLLMVNKLFLHTSNAKAKLLARTWHMPKTVLVHIPVVERKVRPKTFGRAVKALAFGFISSDKGTDIAIEALGDIPNVKLKVVGSLHPDQAERQQPFLHHVEALAKKYRNVTLLVKFVSEQEKSRLFSEADLVIMPYRFIEQSAVMTETWSYLRIPAVADLPSMKEELENGKYGILFRAGSAGELRKAVLKIAADRPLQGKILGNIAKLARERSFSRLALRFMSETFKE